eukprot:31057-Pelagococcus_subviridis.AAC.9
MATMTKNPRRTVCAAMQIFSSSSMTPWSIDATARVRMPRPRPRPQREYYSRRKPGWRRDPAATAVVFRRSEPASLRRPPRAAAAAHTRARVARAFDRDRSRRAHGAPPRAPRRATSAGRRASARPPRRPFPQTKLVVGRAVRRLIEGRAEANTPAVERGRVRPRRARDRFAQPRPSP